MFDAHAHQYFTQKYAQFHALFQKVVCLREGPEFLSSGDSIITRAVSVLLLVAITVAFPAR